MIATKPRALDEAILARVIAPDEPTLSPAIATEILNWKFTADDERRREELAEKSLVGTLSEDEQEEADGFEQVDRFLEVLKSKARCSLEAVFEGKVFKPKPFIQDNGRISGTRHSIYDVMDYYQRGWRIDEIALMCRLRKDQVAVAIEYIDAHRAQVEREHEAFKHRKNSHEVQAIIDAGAPIVKARIAELRRKISERKKGHPSRPDG